MNRISVPGADFLALDSARLHHIKVTLPEYVRRWSGPDTRSTRPSCAEIRTPANADEAVLASPRFRNA
jgi:hypothetical protein